MKICYSKSEGALGFKSYLMCKAFFANLWWKLRTTRTLCKISCGTSIVKNTFHLYPTKLGPLFLYDEGIENLSYFMENECCNNSLVQQYLTNDIVEYDCSSQEIVNSEHMWDHSWRTITKSGKFIVKSVWKLMRQIE